MRETEIISGKGKLLLVTVGFIPEVVAEQVKALGVPAGSKIIIVGMYFDEESRARVEEAAERAARELSGLAPTALELREALSPAEAVAWLAEILWREWRPGGAAFLLGGGSRVLFAASLLLASIASHLGIPGVEVYVTRDYEPRIVYRVPMPPPAELAPSDVDVLTALLGGPASQEDLEARAKRSRPSVSRSLRRLEALGLAEPAQGGKRRGARWRLTPLGKAMALLATIRGEG